MKGRLLASGICGLAVAPATALAAPQDAATDPAPAAPIGTAVEGVLLKDASQKLKAATVSAKRKVATERQASASNGSSTAAPAVAPSPVLQSIAQCESSGNPGARSGPYGGLFQFDAQTWASVGGTGDPATASPQEQEMRATLLYQREGTTPWPVCGAGK